jgi:hypothetical protein
MGCDFRRAGGLSICRYVIYAQVIPGMRTLATKLAISGKGRNAEIGR